MLWEGALQFYIETADHMTSEPRDLIWNYWEEPQKPVWAGNMVECEASTFPLRII